MGSLFRSREWWATKCGVGEVGASLLRHSNMCLLWSTVNNVCAQEFDQGCMCTGNVDNDPTGSTKVACL